jgi:GT2 family glycosyltransferase
VEPTTVNQQSVAVSIVSHGHGPWVLALLRQMARQPEPCVKRVILTLNVPEPGLQQQLEQAQAGIDGLHLDIRHNRAPQGFARNHNRALHGASEDFVCILNPDMALLQSPTFGPLLACASQPGMGLAYPVLCDPAGQWQDNERALPSLRNLLRRRVLRQTEHRVDWVSGACMVLRTRDWQALGGFDEGFHMYCEDVDFSLRVRQQIGALVRAPVWMQHQAQRASSRQWLHLWWHVRSMWRLWHLPSFRWALQHPSSQPRQPPPARPGNDSTPC